MNHSCEIHDPIDVEERKKLNSPDAIQFVLTLFTFFGSLLLKLKYTNCSWDWDLWVDIMFYGSLVWLAFLFITMVVKFKNTGVRKYLKYLDIFFFLFHIAMWVWLVVIISKDEYFNKCSDPVDIFGFAYLILGAIAMVMIGVILLGACCGKLSPKSTVSTGMDRVIYDNADEDVDFNPYQ